MASVDLEELIPDVEVEMNIPGGDAFAAVSAEEWVNRLRNGFWNAHLDGLMEGWTETDGVISKLGDPTAAAMTRDQQQIVVIYTVMNAIKNNLLNLNTAERYKAGSVSYEVERSAQVYRALIDDMAGRLQRILDRLADTNSILPTLYFDTYPARQAAIAQGLTHWIGN